MRKYKSLWPLLILLIIESLGLAAALILGKAPVTVFSALISAIILSTGLLPALLRPGYEHLLASCLATVFACFLLIPFEPPLNDIMKFGPQPEDISTHMIFRLLNGAAMGPLLAHLTSLFPRRSSQPNWIIGGMYGLTTALVVIFFLVPPGEIKKWIFGLMVIWLMVMVAWALRQLVETSRNPNPEHRRAAQQARLLIFSLLLANSGLFLRLGLIAIQDQRVTYNLALAPQIFLPLGVTYAILRTDLFDIDAALRRALAYTSLSIVLLAGYLGLTVSLTAILAQTWPQFRGLAAVIGVLAAAAAFEPLRGRLQHWIDQLLYPYRLIFQAAVEQSHEKLAQVIDREQIINLLTQDFPEQIGADWGWLSLAPAPDVPGDFESEPSWNAQLIVAGSSFGRYWLGPRRAGPSFSQDEQAQLISLVGQAALALAYAETIEEINALNRQLETRVQERTNQVLNQQRALAVLEERQRLARELHDSVTQTLFGINLNARVIRGLLYKDIETAGHELIGLEQSAQDASTEMRALLQQLRNPQELVTVQGLVEFNARIETLCQEMESNHKLRVSLQLPSSILIPATLANEVSAIIREALINAAKHSGVTEATCSATQINTQLIVRVVDQGRGFSMEKKLPQGHFGLRGMRERAISLNGTIEIQSLQGKGTTIEARFPLGNS